jgi:hypothetical protein
MSLGLSSIYDKGLEITIYSPSYLPKVLAMPIFKSIEFFQPNPKHEQEYEEKNTMNMYRCESVSRVMKRKYSGFSISQSPDNIFAGFIPAGTKKKIKKAKEIFDQQIYIIGDTPQENWHKTTIAKEGLITGVILNQSFLIDHFQTEPIEQYLTMDYKKIINQEK